MFVLRPEPDKWSRAEIAAGRDAGVSPSWWEKGALVVDESGPAVVDAEGRRVPVPVPPGGATLIRAKTGSMGSSFGPSAGLIFNSICDRDRRAVAGIPGNSIDGFDVEGLKRFAAAAGFGFEEVMMGSAREFPEVEGFVALQRCVRDDGWRRRRSNRFLSAIGLGGKKDFSPYRDGVEYPPMDPAYLDQ